MMMGGFEYYISLFLSVCVPSCARVPYRLSLLIDPTHRHKNGDNLVGRAEGAHTQMYILEK